MRETMNQTNLNKRRMDYFTQMKRPRQSFTFNKMELKVHACYVSFYLVDCDFFELSSWSSCFPSNLKICFYGSMLIILFKGTGYVN